MSQDIKAIIDAVFLDNKSEAFKANLIKLLENKTVSQLSVKAANNKEIVFSYDSKGKLHIDLQEDD